MFPGAKIVAIDDIEDHLKAIIDALRGLGLACISYQYPDEQPNEGATFGGIRLFITDINLIGGDSPGDEARKLAPVVSLVERIISDENGPYALITWSDQGLHDDLIRRIAETASLKNRQPLFSLALEKSEFLGEPAKLKAAIEQLLGENAPFGALLDWEKRVSNAAQCVLRTVSKMSTSFEGDTASEKLDFALSSLAKNAFGAEHVEAHRFEAVNEALFPLLNDELNREFFSGEGVEIWERAVTKHNDVRAISKDVVTILNTAVFFEPYAGFMPYRRGVVLRVPPDWVAQADFERRFGVSPDDLAKKFFQPKQGAEISWVLVQTQAACDFAQPKLGPIPYCLGAVIKEDHVSTGKLPQYVWRSPLLTKADDPKDAFHLFVAVSISVPLTRADLDENGFVVLGRLKDQVLNELTFERFRQGARPGLIKFE